MKTIIHLFKTADYPAANSKCSYLREAQSTVLSTEYWDWLQNVLQAVFFGLGWNFG